MITAFLRTVILYVLIMTGLRLTGKRQIGQLEPIELVLTMTLSDLASVPMQDFGIPLLSGVIPIVTLLALSTLLSWCSMRNIRFRSLACGEPAIVIHNGVLQQDVMQQNRLTLDEILEELRIQGVSDITTVKYAVLETSGQLSLLLYADEQPATPQQLGMAVEDDVTLPTVLINDGRLLAKNLKKVGLNDTWLFKQLEEKHIKRTQDVFFMTIDENRQVVLVEKEKNES